MSSFVSASNEHPLTARRDEIVASLAVKGSLTDQRAQCEHAHLLFLSIKHNDPPPFLSFPPSSLSSHLLPWGAVLGFLYWVTFAEPCSPCRGIVLTSQHPDWAKMSSATLFKSWLKTLWAALQTGSRLSKMASRLLTRCWWFVALL